MTPSQIFATAHALTRLTLAECPQGTDYRATFGAALRIVYASSGWGVARLGYRSLTVVAPDKATVTTHTRSQRRTAGTGATVDAVGTNLYLITLTTVSRRAREADTPTADNRPRAERSPDRRQSTMRRVFPCASLPPIGTTVEGLGTVTGYGRVWCATGHDVDQHGLDPWTEGDPVRYAYAA